MMLKTARLTLGIGLWAALAFMAPNLSHADPKDLGLGVMVGAPTGLTGKYWLDDINAIDFAVGDLGYYDNNGYSGVNVHVDYLWHHYGIFGDPASDAYNRLPLYVGVGGMIESPGVAGVRGVLGITYLFHAPFDLFFEVAPTLVIAPNLGFGIDANLGGRVYFF
jgi:hypothetical protein